MATRGSDAKLYMGDTAVKAQMTELTAPGLGCSTVEVTHARPSKVVPGYDLDQERETTERVDTTGSFTIEANAVTAPLFKRAMGQRKFFQYAPRGESAGKVVEAFAAFITMTIGSQATGSVTFDITLAGDSDVAYTTV